MLQHALSPNGRLSAGRWLFDMCASSHQIPEKHSRALRKYLVTPYFRVRLFRNLSNANERCRGIAGRASLGSLRSWRLSKAAGWVRVSCISMDRVDVSRYKQGMEALSHSLARLQSAFAEKAHSGCAASTGFCESLLPAPGVLPVGAVRLILKFHRISFLLEKEQ